MRLIIGILQLFIACLLSWLAFKDANQLFGMFAIGAAFAIEAATLLCAYIFGFWKGNDE